MAFATRNVDLVSGICELYKDGKLISRHMTSCADGLLPMQDLLDLDNGWNAGQFFYQPEVFFSVPLWSGRALLSVKTVTTAWIMSCGAGLHM